MFEGIWFDPMPDDGATGSAPAAGPAPVKVLVNALDLIGLRQALALMAPAAALDRDDLVEADSPGNDSGTPPNAIASPDGPEAEAIDRIHALEALKAACAAAQARETAALHAHRTHAEGVRGIPVTRRGRGLPGEVALARKAAHSRGSHHLRLALNLLQHLPHTLEALTDGTITEDQAAAVDRQTHWLDPHHRHAVDAALADRLGHLSHRELTREAQAHAQGQDPTAAVEHQEQACRDRHLSLKPAESSPGMAYLTALLPLAQAAACHQSLTAAAATLIAGGDAGERTPQQVLTDTFVERLTGQSEAGSVPVEIQLVMTDQALLEGDHAPAWIPGLGPIPAATARGVLSDTEADVFLRRLYTAPETGHLVAMDSHRRTFTGGLRQMILIRDDTCRTPFCAAPIRHLDHATPHRDGGTTSYANGSGLCVRCNQTKEQPGWAHRSTPDELTVTTPTGHQYTRRPRRLAPPAPSGVRATTEPPGTTHTTGHRVRLPSDAPLPSDADLCPGLLPRLVFQGPVDFHFVGHSPSAGDQAA
ncbi:DUF222 domain-containing protein [Citricoccus zhacaiensis]